MSTDDLTRLGVPAALERMDVHPDVDTTTADQVAYQRLDGTPVSVGQVAEAQARLLNLIHRHAVQLTKSGNPARRATGAEVLHLMGRQ